MEEQKMRNGVDVSTLPPDIIRIIITTAEKPLGELRLISHTWNKLVLEYLLSRRNNRPLRIVQFKHAGIFRNKEVNIKAYAPHEHLDHFINIFRGWETTDPNISVFESTLLIRALNTEYSPIYVLCIMIIASTYNIHFLLPIPLLFLYIAYYVRDWYKARPIAIESRRQLNLIFSRCSNIEKLRIHDINRETLAVIRGVLGDVPIKELSIMTMWQEEFLRNDIIKLARAHKVQRIMIFASRFKAKNLRKFFVDVTETVKDLIILESNSRDDKIFGRPREFWEKKARELSDGSFSVQVLNGECIVHDEKTHVLRLRICA